MSDILKFSCKGEDEMSLVAEKVLSLIGKLDNSKSVVVGLRGNLGSGKTTFTKYFAKALNVSEEVTSPTFVIQKSFDIDFAGRYKKLYHLDVYRVESDDEMKAIKWDEIINDPENIILVEWPENIEGVFPKETMMIDFTFVDENTRDVEIKTNG